ncbi:MAG: hypothetical protein IH600_14640 [Bacteroidetes bacterium]|nr:hypothetical protein [Bacteroidota bacterium]
MMRQLIISCILVFAAMTAVVRAQSATDSLPLPVRASSLVLTVGGGYSRYMMPYEAPFTIDRNGAVLSARLLWHPDHRLRLGVESGWTRFYTYKRTDVETSFGTTDASLSLSAVPLLAVFSMQIHGAVTLFAGSGGYFVRSHAVSFGTTVDVTRFSQGWMAAVSWDYPVWPEFRPGLELTWYGATEFGDGVVTLQLRLPITLIRW